MMLDLSTTTVHFPQQSYSLAVPSAQRPPDYVNYSQIRGEVRWSEISDSTRKISELASMDENWDGYGALRISPETTSNTLSCLDNLLRVAPVPDITPNPNGTISLEWETERGVAHLEIGKTRFSFYLKLRSGKPILADGLAKHIPEYVGGIVSSFLFPVQNAAGTMTKITVGYHVHTSA